MYVTTALGVPVKVIVPVPPEQSGLEFTEIEAVGAGITVMVTVPVCGCEHDGVPAVATDTRLIVVVLVYVPDRVAVPPALRVIVWFVPPLMA